MDKKIYPTINGIYSHYKGGTYIVLNLAKNTENDEIVVVYRSIEFGSYYTRPLSQWFEFVKDQNDTDVPRFRFLTK
jgi:hypothetical protein